MFSALSQSKIYFYQNIIIFVLFDGQFNEAFTKPDDEQYGDRVYLKDY